MICGNPLKQGFTGITQTEVFFAEKPCGTAIRLELVHSTKQLGTEIEVSQTSAIIGVGEAASIGQANIQGQPLFKRMPSEKIWLAG